MATTVPCPNCRSPSEWSERNPFRPFCSERCKLGDLGDWFQERHHIPGPQMPDEILDEIDPEAERFRH